MKYASLLLVLLLAITAVDSLGCVKSTQTTKADPEVERVINAYPDQDLAKAPEFDGAFNQQWRDGKAEMSAYRMTFLRYGQERVGNAVTIFVTEPFTNKQRVKADYDHGDNFDVFKLNLVMDFPTGVYDYNIMSSVFMSTQSVNGQAPGSLTKSVTSIQEWCGTAYAEAIVNETDIEIMHRGYFDGHAGAELSLPNQNGISEDVLMFWARGWAWPNLEPGESYETKLLSSTLNRALFRVDMVFDTVVLTRGASTETITVPAGSFEVEKLTANINNGQRIWTFYVEKSGQRRIITWKNSAGMYAELIGSQRWPYWSMSGAGMEKKLKELGMTPRQPDMP